jgi:glycosyltransferase involved in cell wall biosynthesis
LKRPTLYINGRFLGQRLTGVQRYALETLLALDEELSKAGTARSFDAVVLAPPGTPAPALRSLAFRCQGPFRGQLWEQLTLPVLTRGGFLLGFCPTGPLLKNAQVVTIHDAAVYRVPESYGRLFRSWYKFLLPRLARQSALVMTVSEFAKSELIATLDVTAERVRVSGEGWQHLERIAPQVSVLEKHGLKPGGYVLSVSSLAPHKNFRVIARALEHLKDCGLTVVVAGAVDERVFDGSTEAALQSLELVGYVSDQELRALYEHAAMFVHPSYYEGFGIPPLEAMASGCPVLASNAGALPEVCGDAALYFHPDDPLELAALIRRLWSDPAERAALVQRGHDRLRAHSWTGTAHCHLAVVEELLRSRSESTAAAFAEVAPRLEDARW